MMQTFLCACITAAITRDQRHPPTKGEKNHRFFNPEKKENQIKQTKKKSLLSVKISNADLKISVLNLSGLSSVFVSHDALPQPRNTAAAAAAEREKRAKRARRPATSTRSRH